MKEKLSYSDLSFYLDRGYLIYAFNESRTQYILFKDAISLEVAIEHGEIVCSLFAGPFKCYIFMSIDKFQHEHSLFDSFEKTLTSYAMKITEDERKGKL